MVRLLQLTPEAANRFLNRFLRWLGLVLAGLVLILALVSLLRKGPPGITRMPDFRQIEDVRERKAAFFAFLKPFTEAANRDVGQARDRLQQLKDRSLSVPLNRRDLFWLTEMETAYALPVAGDEEAVGVRVDRLLRRVDIIPPSMALAQAALESGWGTSRFAREGNNLFGIWCWEPGCGIVPERRPPGRSYEVAAYASPRACFLDYMRNLNTHEAYRDLRSLRAGLREAGEPVAGPALLDGLYRYSQEGWTYVGKVRRVIQSNQLTRYDEAIP